jgi:hypothetical protein
MFENFAIFFDGASHHQKKLGGRQGFALHP